MAVLDHEGGNYFGYPGKPLIRVPGGLAAANDDERNPRFGNAWVAQANGGGIMAVGMGNRFQLFSVLLGAPIGDPVTVEDAQMTQKAEIEPMLSWHEDGTVVLDYVGRTFTRAALPLDVSNADYMDPTAPLRYLGKMASQ